MSEGKPDSVPGLGFKDKEKALDSIKNLEGRDPDYQKFAVKGLVGRAKRVLTLTKDKEKLQNINDAIKTFEEWLKDYEKSNKSRDNRPYLPLNAILVLLQLKDEYKLEDKQADAFLQAYKSVKGEYKNLRTVTSAEGEPTWDIVRNKVLARLMKKIDDDDNSDLWKDDVPSKEHMELILWAYSPEASKIKKNLSKFEEKFGKPKDDKESDDDDIKEEAEKKALKRKSDSGSTSSDSASDDESPKKKSRK